MEYSLARWINEILRNMLKFWLKLFWKHFKFQLCMDGLIIWRAPNIFLSNMRQICVRDASKTLRDVKINSFSLFVSSSLSVCSVLLDLRFILKMKKFFFGTLVRNFLAFFVMNKLFYVFMCHFVILTKLSFVFIYFVYVLVYQCLCFCLFVSIKLPVSLFVF